MYIICILEKKHAVRENSMDTIQILYHGLMILQYSSSQKMDGGWSGWKSGLS